MDSCLNKNYSPKKNLPTLVSNLNDCFEQETISLLSDVEDLFIFSLRDSENINWPEYAVKLKSDGVQYFKDDVSNSRLKWEFANIHTQLGEKLDSNLNCFHDILDFFSNLEEGTFN